MRACSKFKLRGTDESHTGIIRHVATYTDGNTVYLASTGEDKQLHVYELPTFANVYTRELPKRATALVISPEGDILISDKFGDVYRCVMGHF